MRIGSLIIDLPNLRLARRAYATEQIANPHVLDLVRLRCVRCAAFTLGCDDHWLCGVCPCCVREMEADRQPTERGRGSYGEEGRQKRDRQA